MANLVAGQIDHWWRVSLGLSRCELCQCPVWPHGIDTVQIVRTWRKCIVTRYVMGWSGKFMAFASESQHH